MSHILRIRRGQSTWKYLGIPIPIARAERRGAIKLKETILDRLQVWKAQLLSKAGRFSLIRSVLQALPLHLANSASLSVTTAQQVEMLTRKFFWQGGREHRSIHCINWERLLLPKDAGGLGLRSILGMRKAALAALAYRVLLQPSELTHFFSLKYRWEGNPWEIGPRIFRSPICFL
ncbi:hypothetical protein QJS10_CPA01g00322 [Acorus calamus]|uniref:Uncharacterized protein n=1 Tax=Acorus calamus TaxID=4465 RepID=A0AAV9FKM0_ACOCL|nr:hypothetical protein QJS10_CPA01g00322 [Acorus calamus]